MTKAKMIFQQLLVLTLVLLIIFAGCSTENGVQSSESSELPESSQAVSSSESSASSVSEVSSEVSSSEDGSSSSSSSPSSSTSSTSSVSSSVPSQSSSTVPSSTSPSSSSSSKPQGNPVAVEFNKEKFYIFTNVATGKVLSASTSSTGRRVMLSDKLENDGLGSQHWQIFEYKKGQYSLVVKNSGKSLTAPEVSISLDDTRLLDAQLWKIVTYDGKNFKISRGNLFLTGGETVSMSEENDSNTQLWKIDQLNTKDWTLVWSDEFNGSSIDRNVWNYEDYYANRGDQQVYTSNSRNSFIKDGNLVIRTLKEPTKDRYTGIEYPYSSASLNTKGKKSFLYGKFEIRCKLPSGPRIWPAFWTDGDVDPNWPQRGEIDIFEFYGDRPREIKANIWRGRDDNLAVAQQWGAKTFRLPDNKEFPKDFHIMHAEWDQYQIRFYCDGLHYATYNISNGAGDKKAFSQPHFIWVNTAIENDKAGYPSASTNTYPQDYIIDYIRVYQQK